MNHPTLISVFFDSTNEIHNLVPRFMQKSDPVGLPKRFF